MLELLKSYKFFILIFLFRKENRSLLQLQIWILKRVGGMRSWSGKLLLLDHLFNFWL